METNFIQYIVSQKPLEWTIIKNHVDHRLKGNNALVINLVRFSLIIDLVKKYFTKKNKILDIGIYPGILPKIFYEFYPLKGNYEYFGVGLGFDNQFINKMKDYNVKLFEVDLDPRLKLNRKLKNKIPINDQAIDFCFLTDVIEHFFDPIYPLREINRVSKMGAILIVSTDNLSRFHALINFLKGRSPNVPLLEGNLFYDGDWRPHFREYSKDELSLLLKWSGYEIIEHQYYSSEFGEYKKINNNIEKQKISSKTFKSVIASLISKFFMNAFDHMKDNQILVARKRVKYSEVLKKYPNIVHDVESWVQLRKKHK